MAWITSKTGRVYLAICAGITAILLARDVPRLLGARQAANPAQIIVAPFAPHPPRMEQTIPTLPPSVGAGDIATLPPITMKAMDTVTLPSGAEFRLSHLVQTAKKKEFVAFKPDGSPTVPDTLSLATLRFAKSPQCYLQFRQEQHASQPDQPSPISGRWGGFSAANHRLIHGYAAAMNIALTPQEQKTGKVECVIPQMPLARTVAQFPLTNNSRDVFTVDDYVIRYNDDSMEYTVTLPAKTQDTVDKDGFRVVLMGRRRDSRWQPIRLLETTTSSAFPQGRNTPEELRKYYCFRVVSQPSAPADFDKVAVVLVPYQKVTITGIVMKPKTELKTGAKP